MKNNPILKLKNINETIGKKQILTDIDIEVEHGEIMGLLGPNGSGKTTLIRIIVGLMKANKGQVIVNGHDLDREFTSALSNIGAIVENPEFYEHLTGKQNLQQFAAMDRTISRDRIQEVIGVVNLGDAIDDKVQTYSLGMRQRLGIAQAILHRPSLLILDEPTNGLDPLGMREFRYYIKNLSRQENVSIIIASHLLREIEDLCNRVAIIQNGRILNVRSLSQLDVAIPKLYIMEVDDLKTSSRIIAEMGIEHQEVHSGFVLMTTKQQIPGLISRLVNESIQIYSVTPKHQTLEEAFFEVTGEGSNA